MKSDEILRSEHIEYMDDQGNHINLDVYFFIDMIKVFSFFADDVDEEIVGFGNHPLVRDIAINEAVRDLLNEQRLRLN